MRRQRNDSVDNQSLSSPRAASLTTYETQPPIATNGDKPNGTELPAMVSTAGPPKVASPGPAKLAPSHPIAPRPFNRKPVVNYRNVAYSSRWKTTSIEKAMSGEAPKSGGQGGGGLDLDFGDAGCDGGGGGDDCGGNDNDQGGCDGCFSGDSVVSMADGKEKLVKDIKKGDSIKCNDAGERAKVICVLEMSVPRGRSQLVTFPSGLEITFRHPIFYGGCWTKPEAVGAIAQTSCDVVYNFLLEGGGTVVVGNITCVVVGHQLAGPVWHEFWGDRKKIEAALRAVDTDGFERGRVKVAGTIRDETSGRACGFRT